MSTSDIQIAQNIASAVHYASGGLNYIKAEAKSSDGHVFITLSCTEYQKSPLYRALETIRREAQRFGIFLQGTKLVGIVPQNALLDAAVWYLQLDDFNAHQIIEHCLLPPPMSPAPANFFLDQLAAATPTPGGGAAAAFTAASAAALVSMIAGVTLKNKSYVSAFQKMSEIISKAEICRSILMAAVQNDSEAYEGFLASRRLPQDSPRQKELYEKSLTATSLNIIQIPLQVASQSSEIIHIIEEEAQTCPVNTLADAASAAILAQSAVKISALNIQANIQYIQDSVAARNFLAEIRQIEADTSELMIKITQILEKRGYPPISSKMQ